MSATTPTYLHYKLMLRSPAIVSTLSGDANSTATKPFIPGSAIRGALAARLLSGGMNANNAEFRRIILSSEVRFLHAYPEIASERALPTPSSWRSEKGNPSSTVDLAAFSGAIASDVDAKDFEEIWPEKSLTGVAGAFTAASVSAGARSIVMPRINTRLHQQRDRTKGRPWKDKKDSNEQPYGAIFAYEYLEPEQVFRGIIQVMPEAIEDIERIQEILRCNPILIGRSRRAGYGGEADVEFVGQAQREYANVSGSISHSIPGGTCFRVLLTSAYIGRHPATGQIDPVVLEQELCSRLNGAAEVKRRRWSFETVGMFNQKWRLETPQALAVAAGAVLVLMAHGPLSVEDLRNIEHGGLGERRIEGFGRVLFLQHSDEEQTIQLRQADDTAFRENQGPNEVRTVPEQDRKQLMFLEQRIVLTAARAELDRIAAIDIADKATKSPKNSLLGRLRTVFRGVMDEVTARQALATLGLWCDGNNPNGLKLRARRQLEDCKGIPKTDLMNWLTHLASASADAEGWNKLKEAVGNSSDLLNPIAQNHHLTSTQAAQDLLNAHAGELCVYLIDAVLSTMTRLNGRDRRGAQ